MYRDPNVQATVLLVALGGNVAGLDPATGLIIWRNDLTGGGLGAVDLACDGEIVVASASSNRIFALSYLHGTTLWTSKTVGSGRATVVVEGETIYVVKGGYVEAFTRSGQQIWKQDLPGLGMGRAALGFPGNLRQADDVGSQ